MLTPYSQPPPQPSQPSAPSPGLYPTSSKEIRFQKDKTICLDHYPKEPPSHTQSIYLNQYQAEMSQKICLSFAHHRTIPTTHPTTSSTSSSTSMTKNPLNTKISTTPIQSTSTAPIHNTPTTPNTPIHNILTTITNTIIKVDTIVRL